MISLQYINVSVCNLCSTGIHVVDNEMQPPFVLHGRKQEKGIAHLCSSASTDLRVYGMQNTARLLPYLAMKCCLSVESTVQNGYLPSPGSLHLPPHGRLMEEGGRQDDNLLFRPTLVFYRQFLLLYPH